MPAASVDAKVQRLEISFQDEISGHLRPWVTIENEVALKRAYPEVHSLLFKQPFSHYTASVLKRIKKRSYYLNFYILALLLLGGVVAVATHWYFKSGANTSQRAIELYSAKQFQELELFLTQALKDQGANALIEQKALMPFFRWQAVQGNGAIIGFSARNIFNGESQALPPDCSIAYWDHEFRSSLPQWQQFFQGQKLVFHPWLQVLAWFPLWILSRRDSGWISPKNTFAACIELANRSFSKLIEDPTFKASLNTIYPLDGQAYQAQIAARLNFLQEQVNQEKSPKKTLADGILAQWSCFEASENLLSLSDCSKIGIKKTIEIEQYTSFRYNYIATFFIMNKRSLLGEDFNFLASQAAIYAKPDLYTRVSFFLRRNF